MRKFSTLLVAGAAVIALGLTGCSSDPLAEQYREGSNKNYIAGDGSVTEITLENRGDVITFSGTTETGATVSSADYWAMFSWSTFGTQVAHPAEQAPDLEQVCRDRPSG
jgi:hypothetical protein